VASKLSGAPLETFYEVWSFARRVGAQTLAKGGSLEGRCPECGADVPPAETVRCEFCKAIVNSGLHDWVLAEITQIVEGICLDGHAEMPGFAALKAATRASTARTSRTVPLSSLEMDGSPPDG